MEPRYSCPRGTRDVIYPETKVWQKIISTAKEIFKLYNYKEIKTPIFENTELFIKGTGEDTDIVTKEMYTFPDKKGRSLTLRPEGTPGVARAFLEQKMYTESSLVKLWYVGQMFRYERKQAGRQRQFEQIGIEAFGSSDPRIDAESIEILFLLYEKLGLKDIFIHLNSIGCEKCRPEYKQNLKTFLTSVQLQLCVDCQTRLDKNPLRVLDCKNPSCQQFLANIPDILDFLCQECKTHFDKVKHYLELLNIKYQINNRLVRGLDYYTKTVFETFSLSEALGAQNSLCGGGRYDNLVSIYGGDKTPAFGWAFGVERLAMILAGQKNWNIPCIDYFIVTLGEQAQEIGFNLLSLLRKNNISAELDYIHGAGGLKKQLKPANKLGCSKVIIIGEDEINTGQFILKNMVTGAQEFIPSDFDRIIKYL